MKKPLEVMISEVWKLFAGNIILAAPAAGVAILNIIVYGFLAAVLFFLCIKDFLGMGYNLNDPHSIPYSEMLSYFGQFVFYLAGIIIIIVIYNMLISIFHRAGWGYMHARAVVTGKADISDYFAGIAGFSGRMFWFTAVRMSILWVPPLILLVLAAVTAKEYESQAPFIFVAAIASGAAFIILVEIVLWFYMWMWRPVMFVKNIPVMDALFESISFTNRHIWPLMIFFILWICLIFTTGVVFALFNTMANVMMGSPDSPAAFAGSAGFVSLFIARWGVSLLMKIVFSLFYYNYYFEETTSSGSINTGGFNPGEPAPAFPRGNPEKGFSPPAGLPSPWEPSGTNGPEDSGRRGNLPPGFC